MSYPTIIPHVYEEVQAEVHRAHKKHGDKSMYGPYTNEQRYVIVGEEVGEVAHELTYDADSSTANLREELIQVAAMCVSWIEALDGRSTPG